MASLGTDVTLLRITPNTPAVAVFFAGWPTFRNHPKMRGGPTLHHTESLGSCLAPEDKPNKLIKEVKGRNKENELFPVKQDGL